jgi:hypothetical protein
MPGRSDLGSGRVPAIESLAGRAHSPNRGAAMHAHATPSQPAARSTGLCSQRQCHLEAARSTGLCSQRQCHLEMVRIDSDYRALRVDGLWEAERCLLSFRVGHDEVTSLDGDLHLGRAELHKVLSFPRPAAQLQLPSHLGGVVRVHDDRADIKGLAARMLLGWARRPVAEDPRSRRGRWTHGSRDGQSHERESREVSSLIENKSTENL